MMGPLEDIETPVPNHHKTRRSHGAIAITEHKLFFLSKWIQHTLEISLAFFTNHPMNPYVLSTGYYIYSIHRGSKSHNIGCNETVTKTEHWSHIKFPKTHHSGVIMSTIVSQITSASIVCLIVCSGGDQRKYKISASLAFLGIIHRWPVDSPHKGPNASIW